MRTVSFTALLAGLLTLTLSAPAQAEGHWPNTCDASDPHTCRILATAYEQGWPPIPVDKPRAKALRQRAAIGFEQECTRTHQNCDAAIFGLLRDSGTPIPKALEQIDRLRIVLEEGCAGTSPFACHARAYHNDALYVALSPLPNLPPSVDLDALYELYLAERKTWRPKAKEAAQRLLPELLSHCDKGDKEACVKAYETKHLYLISIADWAQSLPPLMDLCLQGLGSACREASNVLPRAKKSGDNAQRDTALAQFETACDAGTTAACTARAGAEGRVLSPPGTGPSVKQKFTKRACDLGDQGRCHAMGLSHYGDWVESERTDADHLARATTIFQTACTAGFLRSCHALEHIPAQ